MTRKIKLKLVAGKQYLNTDWCKKVSGLSKWKWTSVKRIIQRKSFILSFLDQNKKVCRPKLLRTKSSFSSYKQLINMMRTGFGKLNTGTIKSFVKEYKARSSFNRTVYLTNAFERRICVVMTRSKFFPTILSSLGALQTGDVFINGRSIRNPNYQLLLGDVLIVRGETRKIIYNSILSNKDGRSIQKNMFTKDEYYCLGDTRKARLKAILLRTLIRKEKILAYFQNLDKRKLQRLKTLRSPLPAHLPSCFLVDFLSLSLCLKSSLTPTALATHYKYILPSMSLWRG